MSLTNNTSSQRNYSVGELQSLIAAKDSDIAHEQAARASLTSAPDASWDGQFAALQSSYAAARSAAEHYAEDARIANIVIPFSDYTTMDATGAYHSVLSSFNSTWAANTVAPGSFDDLDARLRTAAASQGSSVPVWTDPQPDPSQDSGLDPRSWQGYATGLAYKFGFVPAIDVPPGTPGGPDGTPFSKICASLPPNTCKYLGYGAAVGGVGLVAWTIAKVKDAL